MTTPPRRPSSASRATRRSRRPAAGSATFLARNRTTLTWVAGLLGFLLLASAFFLNASRPTYACTEQFNPTAAPSWVPPTEAPSRPPSTATPVPATPTPAPPTPAPTDGASPPAESPAPSPDASPAGPPPTSPPVTAPPPGYVQMDGGAGHVSGGTTVRYPSCPPASGKHYEAPAGPIRAGFYGLNDQAVPPGWVHNLEHGYTVLLYRCTTPGTDQLAEACTDTGQAALRDMITRWPPTPYCGTPPGTFNPVIARFDDMAWPYAVLVWDVILPLQTLDEAAIFDFQAQRGERFNPEVLCPDPTPTPGPGAPTPVVSPAPSGASPAPSGATSPGVPPAASPAASPPASTAPASS